MKRSQRTALFFSFLSLIVLPISADDPCKCPKQITSPLTIQKVEDAIKCCQIKHVEDVLPLLPDDFRSRYVLVHDSKSRQKSDWMHPRIIFFGLDAKMIVAVGSGDKKHGGFAGLEMIQFDDCKKEFLDPVEILFPADNDPPDLISPPKKMPKSTCQGCHREKARPNWDSYDGWPGVYGSDGDSRPAIEDQRFKEFWQEMVVKQKGRYKYFKDDTQYTDQSGYRDYYHNRPNLQFTALLSRLNAQANARMIAQNEDLKQFRYALLAVLSCNEPPNDIPVEKLIPEEISKEFAYPYRDLLEDTVMRLENSIRARTGRQCEALEKMNNGVAVPKEDCELPMREMFYAPRIAKMRYIMENRGICWDLEQGSMEFRHQHFSFNSAVNRNLGGLDLFLWKELLDPAIAIDKDLIDIYERAEAKRDADGELDFDTQLDDLCNKLKGESDPDLRKIFMIN